MPTTVRPGDRGVWPPALGWLLLLLLLLCVGAPVDGCPHKCSCSGSHVDCQGLGFKSVPKGIPRNAERLSSAGRRTYCRRTDTSRLL
ncbi:hypothetical protein CRUP_034513 [Coryphaenoides rupestris]|nr:hypothetical protein CRUP_034513 [Coryphaenoides rupestris]